MTQREELYLDLVSDINIEQFASIEGMLTTRRRLVPLGVLGDAWDIGKAPLFLISDDAKFIPGVCLPVDGDQSCVTQPID